MLKNEKAKLKDEEEQFVKKIDQIALKISKSPELYIDEVRSLLEEYKILFQEALSSPTNKNKKFYELCIFFARISKHFKKDLDFFEDNILQFLDMYAMQMNVLLRRKLVQAVLILSSKNMVLPIKLTKFMFKLLSSEDKELRKMITTHIINLIKTNNNVHKNNKLNKAWQVQVNGHLLKSNAYIGKRVLQIMVSLYRKNIWNDDFTVNTIANAVTHENYKIKLIVCYFLIQTTLPPEENLDSEDEQQGTGGPIKSLKGVAKQTKSRKANLERRRKQANKRQQSRFADKTKNFFPIDRIYNPQEYCEKMFSSLQKCKDKFIVKQSMMAVLGRMIGRHKLIIISWYSYIQAYITPQQINISKIMSYLAESVHSNIHCDEFQFLIKHILDNFIHDKAREQSITIGINTIYEIVVRAPKILDEFTVNYIASYGKYKNKNVSKSARSIINLYREVNPLILENKYRGNMGLFVNDEQYQKEVQQKDQYIYDKVQGTELIDTGIEGDLPLYMDRMLDDADFRKIKYLQQKKREEQEMERLERIDELKLQNKELLEKKIELKRQAEEEEMEFDEEGSEIDEEEFEEEDISDDEMDGEEGESLVFESVEESYESEEEEDEEEVAPQEENQENFKILTLKQKNKLRIQKQRELEENLEDYSDVESSSEVNPQQLIDPEELGYFKLRKAEARRIERDRKEAEGKYKHKQRHVSQKNEKKARNKPLSMVRPKKNRQNVNQKQLKIQAKNLRAQLGHVKKGSGIQQKKTKVIKK